MHNHEHSKPKSGDHNASPELMKELNRAVNLLLERLTPSSVYKDEGSPGFQARVYDSHLRHGGESVRIAGYVLHHSKLGIVQRSFLRISSGSDETGSRIESDFLFGIDDPGAINGVPVTVDEENQTVSGVNERFYFNDNAAIRKREEELLADPNFDGPTDMVVLPSLQTTPSGEIYEDGSEAVSSGQLESFPEISYGFQARFDDEAEARGFQRFIAAGRQARHDVGSELTAERAERVVALVIDLLQQLPQSK